MPSINERIAVEKEKDKQRQPREHPVPCRRCYKRRTWNNNAICGKCQDVKPDAV